MKKLKYYLISIDSEGFPIVLKLYYTLEELEEDFLNQRVPGNSHIWLNYKSLETGKIRTRSISWHKKKDNNL